MRNQFYADRKDIWKWSLLLELAGDTHHIFQIAMLRPDDESGHGNDFSEPGDCDLRVKEFFERERSEFGNGGCSRNLRQVCRLLPGRITVFSDIYRNGERSVYVERAVSALSNKSPKVVFLDPDNGIEGKTRNHKHLGLAEISRVWNSLSAGDYLVIFQYSFFDRDWRGKKQKLLSNALEQDVQMRDRGSMCFFYAEKRATLAAGVGC